MLRLIRTHRTEICRFPSIFLSSDTRLQVIMKLCWVPSNITAFPITFQVFPKKINMHKRISHICFSVLAAYTFRKSARLSESRSDCIGFTETCLYLNENIKLLRQNSPCRWLYIQKQLKKKKHSRNIQHHPHIFLISKKKTTTKNTMLVLWTLI